MYNCAEAGPMGLLARPRRINRLVEEEKRGFVIFSTKFQACDDQDAAANATEERATVEKARRLAFSGAFEFSTFSAPSSFSSLRTGYPAGEALPDPLPLPTPLAIEKEG